MDEGNLLCLSFVNLAKQSILASYPSTPDKGSVDLFRSGIREVFNDVKKLKNDGSIRRLDLQYHTVYYHVDSSAQLAVLAMVYEESYPIRLVLEVMKDLWTEVNEAASFQECVSAQPWKFQSKLKAPFGIIFNTYDKANQTDAATILKTKILNASDNVENTLHQIMESCVNMEELHHKSKKLRSSAIRLQKDSALVKNSLGKRTIMLTVYVLLTIIVIALYIAIPILLNPKEKST